MEWAAVAIMMHDMSQIYHGKGKTPERPHLRLDAKVDPLSALITLADILQDFERPVGKFSARRTRGVKLSYNHSCKYTAINLDGNSLNINYNMRSKDLAFKRSMIPNEQADFFDLRYGYMNLKAWGLDNVIMQAN